MIKCNGILLVSFSHHISGLEQKDLHFFNLACDTYNFQISNIYNKVGTHMWNDKEKEIFIYELIYKNDI